MPSARIAWIRDALHQTPVKYEFSLGQPEDARQALIASLFPEAKETVFLILTRYVCSGYCENEHREGENGEGLAHLMGTGGTEDGEDDEDVHSDDWRLRVFRIKAGTLYDFNGWPGDNECGAGRFYPKIGYPFDVFVNSDESLEATEGIFIGEVAKYAERREAENRHTAEDVPVQEV